jgi:hypothetical protein
LQKEIGVTEQPTSALRGADVAVDVRRVGQIVTGVVALGLAVLVVLLFVAGARKNAQITTLRAHGVDIEASVTSCSGLLGGSGSNAAGYVCTASFRYAGHHYVETIPGNTLHAPGTTVRLVIEPTNPTLLSTVQLLETEHSSPDVFILPTVLLLVLGGTVALTLTLRRRPGTRRAPGT